MCYDNGLIYTLRSHQTTDIYIGSTTQPLYKRIYQHKRHFKAWQNGKFWYVSSFELMKYDDVYIELLELFPCDSKMQLHKREGELQREMDCCNKFIAGRSKKEYYQDNKNKIKEYMKTYCETNKDKLKEYMKELYQKNKHKVKECYETKKISDNTIICECGGQYTQTNISRHLKTKKHQAYILNVEKLT